MDDDFELSTLAVRAGQVRSQFREHGEAMYLTSSFVFGSAAEAAARFTGKEDTGFIYSRFTNPTVSMFQDRLAALEGAEMCIGTASGMSAILGMCLALLKSGDHVVCSNAVFGSTVTMFSTILGKFGVETTFVNGADVGAWEKAAKPATKLFFLETPSNPQTELADIAAIAAVAKRAGAWLAVDNCFCTPILQRPLELGADLIIHSATKYLDGQGRVLGGAVLGPKPLLDQVFGYMRTAGPTLSAFNAWVLLKGLETLEIRMLAQSERALALAQWLEKHPSIQSVRYPWLASHPQHALAKRQQKAGGTVVTFEVKGGREAAWKLIDSTKLISITANLGDTKSTITHPGTTTHGRITPEARAAAGVSEGMVRVAVGLESVEDLKADLARGL